MASTQYLSKITLYKAVPFDNSYKHSLRATTFEDKKAWLDANYTKREIQNIMYPKIDTTTGKGAIRLEIYDTLAEAFNYCCIQDDHGHNRFCFILGCRYINDAAHEQVATKSVYEFDLEIDVVMTFLLHPNQFYETPIERHHAGHNVFTNLRIAENLPLGEYNTEQIDIYQGQTNDVYGVLVYTPKLNEDGEFESNMYMNRFMEIPNGAKFKIFDIHELQDVVDTLSLGDDRELASPSQIIAIYTIPKTMVRSADLQSDVIFPYNGHYVRDLSGVNLAARQTWNPYGSNYNYPKPTSSTYKNKKIQYYPYNFAQLYNDKGDHVDIRYEDWGGQIDIEYNVTMPVSVRASVRFYNGIDHGMHGQDYVYALNYEKSVEISNYPLGCCSSDSYAAYIAQNGRSMDTASLGTGVALIGALAGVVLAPTTAGASLAAIGGITAGLSTMIGIATKLQSAQDAPDTTQGVISNGNIEYRYKRKVIKMYAKMLKTEYLKLIDSYFTKYGYAQGGLTAKPRDEIRPYYVYIKTMAPCVKPINNVSEPNTNQLTTLNTIFINGITLWNHLTTTKDNIFDYENLDNGSY